MSHRTGRIVLWSDDLVRRLAVDKLLALGCRVWVIGSRARGTQREFSDLDLCFHTPTEISGAILSDIKETLEESSLPIKVDLVSWEDLEEEYRDNVLRDRKEIGPVA